MDSSLQGLLILVPAFNEEAAVGQVIAAVRNVLPGTTVLVVDDGSQDETTEVAQRAGAEVIRLPHHLGLGGAVQTGYRFAFEHGYERVVRLDADGQHPPEEIREMLAMMDKGSYDMVTGSRYLESNGYETQAMRRFGGQVFSLVLRPILGQRISDPTSGFIAVNRNALEVFSHSFPLEYPEIEALVVLRRKAMTFAETPVRMRPRIAGESSIGRWSAVYYMVRVLLGVFVNVIKYEKRYHTATRSER
jgi:glycosyltransferase involved in cell wall biosynthesis